MWWGRAGEFSKSQAKGLASSLSSACWRHGCWISSSLAGCESMIPSAPLLPEGAASAVSDI